MGVEIGLELPSCPKQPGLYGANRYLERFRDLGVTHSFYITEREHFPELGWKSVDCLCDLRVHDLREKAAFGIGVLDRAVQSVWLDRLQIHCHRLVLPAAIIVDEGVPKNGQEPASCIRPRAVLLPGAIRLEHGVLYQILRERWIGGETKRNPVQRIEVGEGFPIEGTRGNRRLSHRRQCSPVQAPSHRIWTLGCDRAGGLCSAPTPVPKPTAAALIPLSLLEALRNLDTPVEDGMDELAEEIAVRRLGLSPTVAAQIQRYRQTAERGGVVDTDEVLSVLRLVGRRPDAPLVFADAGRRAARYAAKSRGRPSRTLARLSPTAVAHRLALRGVSRLARTIFEGEVSQRDGAIEIRMTAPLSIVAAPGGEACLFYGSAYQELLRGMTGFEGALLHESCLGRGQPVCLWRTAEAEVYE